MTNPSYSQSFNQAISLAQSGHKEQANAIFKELIRANPNDSNAHLWFAFTASNLIEARSAIAQAESLQPTNPSLTQAKSWVAGEEARVQAEQTQAIPLNFDGATYGQNPGYQQTGSPYPQPSAYQQNASYGRAVNYFPEKPSFTDRIGLGFNFIEQAFKMLKEDHNLLKPSLYSLGANLVVFIILGIGLIIAYALSRGNNTVLYVGLFLVLTATYFVTYFFSSMTIHLIYQYLTTGRSSMEQAWTATKTKSGPILTVAAISAFFTTLRQFAVDNRRGIWGIVAIVILRIIETVWTAYTFFVLPLIMIENLTVGPAVKRATAIVKNNLVVIGVGYIGIGLISRLIGFVVFVVAGLVAFAIFLSLVKINMILAFALALGLFVLAMAGLSALNTYLRLAYYTTLVVWARDVERMGVGAPAPAPLRTVLEKRAGYV